MSSLFRPIHCPTLNRKRGSKSRCLVLLVCPGAGVRVGAINSNAMELGICVIPDNVVCLGFT